MRRRSALVLLGDRSRAQMVRRQLEQLDYSIVTICESTGEALRYAKATAPDITLVGPHARGTVDAIEAAVLLGQLDMAIVLLLRTMSTPELEACLELELRRHEMRGRHRGPPNARRRILAIDEDIAIRRLLPLVLQAYEVLATEAMQALRYLQAGERYDLILCDVRMPWMSPADFHDMLKELDPEQARRVVFVSAGVSSPKDAEFLAATSCRVLEKPFDRAALARVVAEELRRSGRSV